MTGSSSWSTPPASASSSPIGRTSTHSGRWCRSSPSGERRAARHADIVLKAAAIAATDRALEGITVPTVVHLCCGYDAVMKEDKPIGYSLLSELERCCATAVSIEADQPRLVLAPDYGMKYRARDVAFGKLVEMVEGARAVRGT